MSNMMTIVYKAPGEKPEVRRVPALGVAEDGSPHIKLEEMKKLVGGYIELVRLSEDLDLWLNEEGKLMGLSPNLFLASGVGDVVVGPVFIASSTQEGDTIGLTEDQVVRARQLLLGLDFDRQRAAMKRQPHGI